MVLVVAIDFVASNYYIVYDILNRIFSAAILVIAMYLLKRTITKLNTPEFFGREKLMWMHSMLFITYILTSSVYISASLATVSQRENDEWLKGCRTLIVAEFFTMLT